MKKQLLTALLAFTPFFAFSNEKVSKAELLAHLKHVEAELEATIVATASETTKMNEVAKEFYQEIENLYNLVPDTSNHIDKAFNILTNPFPTTEPISMEELMGFNGFYNFLKDDFIETHKEEIESILTKIDSILIKYNNDNAQSQNNYASILEKEAAPEKDLENCIFIDPTVAAEIAAGRQSQDENISIIKRKLSYCIFILGPMMGMNIAAKKTWPILLQKIDAKIAELE
jgi:hypothetical protein